jgi:predicted SAM-dependent methyltransferase
LPELLQHDKDMSESETITAPLRLHLGCGETYLDGYVNIDYPPSDHNVMKVKADVHADIAKLAYPDNSVEEIRLHHVFEHFNRVTALAMLIRWHSWLKIGGILRIETPDIMGSARTLLATDSPRVRMGVVRHLAGDQAAAWAYHVDHWSPERFEHTLQAFGFASIQARSWNWEQPPFLSNVEVTAGKDKERSLAEQLSAADQLLWESTVADVEKPTHEVWRRQLRSLMGVDSLDEFTPTFAAKMPVFEAKALEAAPAAPSERKGLLHFLGQTLSRCGQRLMGQTTGQTGSSTPAEGAGIPKSQVPAHISRLIEQMVAADSSTPIGELLKFNQRDRDEWVAAKAKTVPAQSSVLDVGAGTCLYRQNFVHCDYRAHDFKQYEGYISDSEGLYGTIDYVSDINSIPVADSSFDVILCTEVLEHVPEPIAALSEMARILKPGGRLLLTAPAMSGLHQLPYHFYSGYTPFWYRHFCEKFGLKVTEISPNGGFFKLLAQECARVAWTMPKHAHLHGDDQEAVGTLFGEILPRYLFSLEEKSMMDQFTVGYHVEAVKKS